MIKIGHGRPNIPEYPQIAEHIQQALEEVYYGLKEHKQALDDAAAKSAKVGVVSLISISFPACCQMR
jgi:multiple sugar transport system substrate-binding protein